MLVNRKTTLKELFTEEELKEFGWNGNLEVTIIHECTWDELDYVTDDFSELHNYLNR